MILYLDLVSGISGDMALGALVDLGVSTDWLTQQLNPVLKGFDLRTEIVFPRHLRAISIYVDVTDNTSSRNYRDIKSMIAEANLPQKVKVNSLAAFEKIARAEAHIHGKDVEDVHFHEIGGVDSLVDIIGTFLGIEKLGVTRVESSPIPLGSGVVECAHGKIPVPVPATLAILEGLPIVPSDAKTEIVTPTGAAIVSTLAEKFGPLPGMSIKKTGVGAGKRDTGSSVPNILRMVLGTPGQEGDNPHILRDRVCCIKTNVDDMNPEITGAVMEQLFEKGALDVTFAPVTMKKNRPGIQLEVICREEGRDVLAELILEQTTAIGLRYHICERMILKRENLYFETGAEAGLGSILVKVVTGPRGKLRILPEYEACREKARALGLPLKEVYDRVLGAANLLDRDGGRLYKTRKGNS